MYAKKFAYSNIDFEPQELGNQNQIVSKNIKLGSVKHVAYADTPRKHGAGNVIVPSHGISISIK
jgi:hypothetical protein